MLLLALFRKQTRDNWEFPGRYNSFSTYQNIQGASSKRVSPSDYSRATKDRPLISCGPPRAKSPFRSRASGIKKGKSGSLPHIGLNGHLETQWPRRKFSKIRRWGILACEIRPALLEIGPLAIGCRNRPINST